MEAASQLPLRSVSSLLARLWISLVAGSIGAGTQERARHGAEEAPEPSSCIVFQGAQWDARHPPFRRFVDKAPNEVYATLLDEGEYHCSIRTMYRILRRQPGSQGAKEQLSHPAYQKPELLATAPNQVWSWDISAP